MALKIDTSKLDKAIPAEAMPIVIKLRNLIFGKKRPDGFTRAVFFTNLIGWFIFFLWNLISYFSLALSDVIKESKGISVNAIVRRRGRQLDFDGQVFLDTFKSFQFFDMFIWVSVFVGLVMLYRKWKIYAVFYFGAIALHFLLMFFMLGVSYFVEDVSLFDKALYVIMIVPALVYIFLLKKEKDDQIDLDSK